MMRMFQHKNLQHKNLKAIQERFEEKTGVLLIDKKENVSVAAWRPLRLCLIVVLVLTLAGAASVGASKLIRREHGGRVEDSYFVVGETDESGNSTSGTNYVLSFAFPADPTAPRAIQDFYLPKVSENYEVLGCYIYGYDGMVTSLFTMWNMPDFNKSGIIYRQETIAGEYCQPETFVIKTHVVSNDGEPEQIEATFGGVTGIYVPEADMSTKRKFFCWSDGTYIYSLEVPYFFTDEQMDTIVGSLYHVENIRPHLTDMSEEQIEALLGKE